MQEMLALLEFKCWYYEEALKDGTESRVQNLSAEEIPKPHRTVKQNMNLLHFEK